MIELMRLPEALSESMVRPKEGKRPQFWLATASYGINVQWLMHSDAQFAGSSSVKSCGLFLLRTSAIQTSLIALGLSSVPAHVEMMGFLGIGNNPMVG